MFFSKDAQLCVYSGHITLTQCFMNISGFKKKGMEAFK